MAIATENEFEELLIEVRNSYRLLSVYQTKLKDLARFIFDQYDLTPVKGKARFSNAAKDGGKLNLKKWSWDWLPMYLFQISAEKFTHQGRTYYFHLLHQADTGFYDSTSNKKLDVLHFSDSDQSDTRIFFILGKNEPGFPLEQFLKDHLSKSSSELISIDGWITKPYSIKEFLNEEKTKTNIKDFNSYSLQLFGLDLINKPTENKE